MRIVTAIAALLLSSTAVFAEVNDDCRSTDRARIISGCGLVIKTKGAVRADLTFALVKRGEAYIINNQLDLAAADLKRAVELDPRNSIAYAVRGWLTVQRNDSAAALTDFNTSLKLSPNYAYALARRGYAYVQLNKFTEAKADLDRAILINSSNAFSYGTRGRLSRLQNDLDAAIGDFTQAIAFDARWAYPLTQRGEVWQLKREYAKALADFDQALVLSPNNADLLAKKQAVASLLQQANPNTRVAAAPPRQQAPGQARPGQPGQQARPNQPAPAQTPTAAVQTQLNEARALLERGDGDGVLRVTEAILTASPNSADAYFLRAQAYLRLKNDNARALTEIDRAVQLAPQAVAVYDLRATVRLRLGQYEEVLADGEQMVRLAPSNWRGFNFRGVGYQETKRHAEAVENFTTALSLNTNKNEQLYLNRSESLIELKQISNAERDIEEALKINAQSSRAFVQRGVIHTAAGRADQAAEAFKAALTIDPNSAAARVGQQALLVAKALMQLGATSGSGSARRI